MLVKVISEAEHSQEGHRGVLHKVKAKLPESQSYEFMLLQGSKVTPIVKTTKREK